MGKFTKTAIGLCLALTLTGGLASCTYSPDRISGPSEALEKTALALDVQSLDIQDAYAPPRAAPFVEHQMINPPYRTVYNSLASRISPTGAGPHMVVTIKEASIKETRTADKTSDFRLWQNQAARQYDARVTLDVKIINPDDRAMNKDFVVPLGTANVDVKRSLELSENLSPAARERALDTMVAHLTNDAVKGLSNVAEERLMVKSPLALTQ